MFWKVTIRVYGTEFRTTVLVVADDGFEAIDKAGLFVPDQPPWVCSTVQYDPADNPDQARELLQMTRSNFNDRFVKGNDISDAEFKAGLDEYLVIWNALMDAIR